MADQHRSPKAHEMIRAGPEFLMEQIRLSQKTIERCEALLKQIDQLRPEDTMKR